MPAPRHYKHLAALIILAICGCFQPIRAEPLIVRSAVLDLHPEQPAERVLGELRYLGGLILASEDSRFGGYSGLVVDADGAGLWAVSDLGHWLRLDFAAGEAAPEAIAAARILPLLDPKGRPVTSKRSSDAEALRRMADGRWLVAFERWHRLWIYAEPGGAARTDLPLPASAADQPDNGGIEAAAVLGDGSLLLLSEEKTGDANSGVAWLQRDGTWQDLVWPLRDGFKPTDAAALPPGSEGAGDVIVLERFFRPLSGPKARLRRIPAAALGATATLPSSVIAEWARPWSVDNMEALDIRRAADGATWLYVMSDDNASSLQRTLLMVFRLEN